MRVIVLESLPYRNQAGVKQVIIELEGSQGRMWSPAMLNGSGFGVMANRSLTMTAYLSRANAAVSDLRELFSRGQYPR